MSRSEATPYATSLDHLSDELRRIQFLLDREVQILRHRGVLEDRNEFQGMFLQEAEVDALLAEDPADDAPYLARAREADRRIALLDRRIRGRVEATRNTFGEVLSLDRLRNALGLDDFEVDTVLLCLAPELDLRFHRLYAYVQSDFTRKRPSVDLVLRLLRRTFRERVAARAYFSPDAPLLRLGVVTLDPPPGSAEVSLLSRELKLSDRTVAFLLGQGGLDPAVAEVGRLVEDGIPLDEVLLPESTKTNVRRIVEEAVAPRGGPNGWPVFLFHGPAGSGKRTLAASLAREAGRPLLQVDLDCFPRERAPFAEALVPVFREAGLLRAFLLFDGYEVLHPPPEDPGGGAAGPPSADVRGMLAAFHHALDRFPGVVFLCSRTHEVRLHTVDSRRIIRVPFEIPRLPVRERLWRRFLPPPERLAPDVDVLEVAARFNLTGGAIRNAIVEAGNLALMRGQGDPRTTRADLMAGCRAQLTHQLATLADRVSRTLSWEDVVLPVETLEHLQEIAKYFRQRNFVFDVWGFDRKLPHGRGLSCLFSGPPGTGKTMVAGIIAGELEMDLYRIDLSRIVSKYVGETEKNLARVFNEAKESHSILLFDEADSLFAKRTEVKTSVDRYANLEVNFLLQKIESFEGITILTTNFDKSIDEAFKRRLNFRVYFPFPDREARVRLWRAMLPKEAPVADDIDFEWLADRYEFAGGNIKNAVLRAAFLAAERGTPIDHACMEAAAAREYHEIGKLVRRDEE